MPPDASAIPPNRPGDAALWITLVTRGPLHRRAEHAPLTPDVTFGQLANDALERRETPIAVTPITGAIFMTSRGTVVLRSKLRRDDALPVIERAGI